MTRGGRGAAQAHGCIKIDITKGRLIKDYGYCDVCVVDVLNYVVSILARGDTRQR